MHRIFAGMAFWSTLFMVAQFALGLLTKRVDPKWTGLHLAFGVFTGVFLCILHVMVMFHFIGSGKEMKEAIAVLGGDAEVVKRLRRLKSRVFPPATFAPLLWGAAVIWGGEAQMRVWGMGGWIHVALAVAGFALNVYAFPIEYRCLVANLELLREVDERLKRELAPGLFYE
jgi:hypothetical protein